MKCILCGEELDGIRLADGKHDAYTCGDKSCSMSKSILIEETAIALEKLAHDVATQYFIADKYEEWAKAHIAELYKERDEARKLAKEYKSKYEEEESNNPIDGINDIISDVVPECWEEARREIFSEGNYGWHMVFRQMLMDMKEYVDEYE